MRDRLQDLLDLGDEAVEGAGGDLRIAPLHYRELGARLIISDISSRSSRTRQE